MRWMFLALALLSTGCKSLFPSEDKRTLNTWQTFEEAQAAFDRIVPHQTTLEDLQEMGFDPKTAPNIKVLTYLDIIRRFIPNQSITKEDLQEDVRRCIACKDCCQAYELELNVQKNKRFGNLFLDLFGFKKQTHVTGWNYQALIIMQDNLVTYKIRSGEPNLDRMEKKVRPLGPLQELDGVAGKLIPGL